jgi:predicted AAA+ superfamily ATPase
MVKKSVLVEVIASQKKSIIKANLGQSRNLLDNLIQKPEHFALIISGIRRCGKSTLLAQYILANIKEAFIYLNFDSAGLYTFELNDFKLLDEIIIENKSKWLIFDEIQIVTGWEIYIRKKLDEGFFILITGSNASLLSKELGTKLTGRHITKELFPFSFSEFCSFKKIQSSEASLKLYLELGGFPGFLKTDNLDIHTALLDDILYRDIAVRHNIRDVKSIKLLLLYIASNCSKLISANKLKQYIGVKSTVTVLEYLHYFEESYLIQLIPKFSYSQKVQLVNPRKVYFIDNGLQQAITTSFSNDIGRKLENIVFWELRKQGKTLYYFNENNKECDFIVYQKDQIENVIQVCLLLNAENEQRELNGLLEAMNFFGLNSGKIITLSQEDVINFEGKRIEVISAYNYLSKK